ATGRADQQDVRLCQLDIIILAGVIDALVMIVYGDRKHFLGIFLPDHVIIEDSADFGRRRHTITGFDVRILILLPNDVHAELDAFITDEHGRAGNELSNLMLALSAEGAVQSVFRIVAAHLAHSPTSVNPTGAAPFTQLTTLLCPVIHRMEDA